jgi:hypothetical protein
MILYPQYGADKCFARAIEIEPTLVSHTNVLELANAFMDRVTTQVHIAFPSHVVVLSA